MRYFFRAILVLLLVGALQAGYYYVAYGHVSAGQFALGFSIFVVVEVLAKLYELVDLIRKRSED